MVKVNKEMTDAWNASRTSAYATVTDTKQTTALKFLQRNIALLIVGLLFVVTYFVIGGIGDRHDAGLAKQQGEVVSLRKELSLVTDEVSTNQSEAVADATGGMDLAHKRNDDAKVTDLMKTALSWNGLREYLKRRETVMNEYSFAEDSSFMTSFMPGEDQGAVRTATSGKTYSSFDPDMSSSFGSLRSVVTSADSQVYTYFTLVELRVKSSSGSAISTGQVAMTYQMIDEKPANVDAYVVTGGVKSSG